MKCVIMLTVFTLLIFAIARFPSLCDGKIRVSLAHLMPNNPNLMYETHVLKLCATDLKERSIIPRELSLE